MSIKSLLLLFAFSRSIYEGILSDLVILKYFSLFSCSLIFLNFDVLPSSSHTSHPSHPVAHPLPLVSLSPSLLN